MNLILDACSTINLHSGNLLEVVLSLDGSGFAFHMGTIVRGECGKLSVLLALYESQGWLKILSGQSLPASRFAELLNDYELGDGETECLAHAEMLDLSICTDDRAARSVVKKHLGEARVVGSLRLIRECVCRRLLSASEGYLGYELMKSKGAFLPEVPSTYFDC